MKTVLSHLGTGRHAKLAILGLATTVACTLGGGMAAAAVDSTDIVVDAKQRTISAIQADTVIRGVPPLDRNPLTRQWLYDGTAEFTVTGDKAEEFTGTIKIGYLLGYPATFGGRIRVGYTSPSLDLDIDSSGLGLGLSISLVPTVTSEIEAGFGPGVRQVEVASGKITGTAGHIQIVNFLGTVTGIIGTATVQPYVTVVSDSGDIVTTLGRVWEI
ncbi:MspA family porin [Nocardia sp. 004]|uniref:MspA family porin n=1 Tax=Nocardia sp. 004 TaxID=3385978 RepID=UPI00399F0DEF